MKKQNKYFCTLSPDKYKEFLYISSLEEAIYQMMPIINKYDTLSFKILKSFLYFFIKRISKLKNKFLSKISKEYNISNFTIENGDIYIND